MVEALRDLMRLYKKMVRLLQIRCGFEDLRLHLIEAEKDKETVWDTVSTSEIMWLSWIW